MSRPCGLSLVPGQRAPRLPPLHSQARLAHPASGPLLVCRRDFVAGELARVSVLSAPAPGRQDFGRAKPTLACRWGTRNCCHWSQEWSAGHISPTLTSHPWLAWVFPTPAPVLTSGPGAAWIRVDQGQQDVSSGVCSPHVP